MDVESLQRPSAKGERVASSGGGWNGGREISFLTATLAIKAAGNWGSAGTLAGGDEELADNFRLTPMESEDLSVSDASAINAFIFRRY